MSPCSPCTPRYPHATHVHITALTKVSTHAQARVRGLLRADPLADEGRLLRLSPTACDLLLGACTHLEPSHRPTFRVIREACCAEQEPPQSPSPSPLQAEAEVIVEEAPDKCKHRYRVIQELVETEQKYVGDLQCLNIVFLAPMVELLVAQDLPEDAASPAAAGPSEAGGIAAAAETTLTSRRLGRIANGAELIYALNLRFLTELRRNFEVARGGTGNDILIGDTLLQYAPYFQMYVACGRGLGLC
jgi:hypothetical protein